MQLYREEQKLNTCMSIPNWYKKKSIIVARYYNFKYFYAFKMDKVYKKFKINKLNDFLSIFPASVSMIVSIHIFINQLTEC